MAMVEVVFGDAPFLRNQMEVPKSRSIAFIAGAAGIAFRLSRISFIQFLCAFVQNNGTFP